eukprot:gene5120-10242_t
MDDSIKQELPQHDLNSFEPVLDEQEHGVEEIDDLSFKKRKFHSIENSPESSIFIEAQENSQRKASGHLTPKGLNVKSKKSLDNLKILECMVCGKKFSRGAVDLSRHQTAITLKHYFSSSRSSTCTLPCIDCGLFFSTVDHLNLHRLQTSCPRQMNKTSSIDFNLSNNDILPFKINSTEQTNDNEAAIELMSSQQRLLIKPVLSKDEDELNNVANTSRRAKKGKLLIPKATPGTTSDPKITSENIFQFIPEKYQPLVERLKQ